MIDLIKLTKALSNNDQSELATLLGYKVSPDKQTVQSLLADLAEATRLNAELVTRVKWLEDARRWYPADQPPDSDTTVIVFQPASDEPVGIGFHNGEEWMSIMGESLMDVVVSWQDFPEPPASPADLSRFTPPEKEWV